MMRSLLILFCLLSVQLFGQFNVDSLFQVSDLHTDLDQLKRKILEIHPNPYVYCSKEEFDEAFAFTKEAIDQPMTYAEFGAVVGRVLRVMHDSHSSINFGKFTSPYKENNARFIDLRIWKTEDKLVIRKSGYPKIPVGSELIQINGVNAAIIHTRLSAFSIYEGLSITGFNRVNDALFSLFSPAFTDFEKQNKALIHIPGDTVLRLVPMRGFTSEEMGERAKKTPVEDSDVYRLDVYEDEDLAVLKIESFAYKGGGKFDRFLKKSFKELKKKGITNLAIDLRDNGGGSSSRVEELFTYLTDKKDIVIPANIVARQSQESYDRFAASLPPYLRKLVLLFARNDEDIQKYTGLANMEVGMLDTVYFKEPEANPRTVFQGKLFLFTNGLSGSASANSSAIFRQLDLGLIIGEPCLGPLSGTWGNPLPIELNQTKLPVLISSIRFNTNNSFEYRPQSVLPDIQVDWKQQEYFDGVDADLEALRKMIAK
ncbi:MAG: hypothetical protein ACJAX8_001455 [Flavobacteriales bacterium]|jgi:hypothetical protein